MELYRVIVALYSLFQLVACAGNPPTETVAIVRSSASTTAIATQQIVVPSRISVVKAARDMLGVPYLYGGASPTGFDCSGLVSYAYKKSGISVPRVSFDQYRQAQKISVARLQPGDLLFFRLKPPKVSHVGIYDGSGRFIHAPSPGKWVSYASLENPYWRKHLVGAGRFIHQ